MTPDLDLFSHVEHEEPFPHTALLERPVADPFTPEDQRQAWADPGDDEYAYDGAGR